MASRPSPPGATYQERLALGVRALLGGMTVAGWAMVSEALQATIRELLRMGRLQRRRPDPLDVDGAWSRPPCAACGHAVTPEELDLELEFDDLSSSATETYRFHATCHAIWEREREAA